MGYNLKTFMKLAELRQEIIPQIASVVDSDSTGVHNTRITIESSV